MRVVIKKILFNALVFSCLYVSGQPQQYKKNETNRIISAQKNEQDIERFIIENLSEYELSEHMANIIVKEASEENLPYKTVQKMMMKAKKAELRVLYFSQNADKAALYVAESIPVEVQQSCADGGFENVSTSGYSFWSDLVTAENFAGCSTVSTQTATNGIIAATNAFTSPVTLISSTSPNYAASDPDLMLLTPPISIPTISNGNGSIKLNNVDDTTNVTSMSQTFVTINEPTFTFRFSAMLENFVNHFQDQRSFFRARALDSSGNVVDEFCIFPNDESCYFQSAPTQLGSSNNKVYYTGWVCASLDVSSILNQSGSIEFTIGDCFVGNHYGTVYIDETCGYVCENPFLDCCPAALTLLPSFDDVSATWNRQARETIDASNTINPTGHAVYHGNFFIELNPNFEAEFGSEFVAYIADCDTGFTYKQTGISPESTLKPLARKTAEKQISSEKIKIFPNPSSTAITISYDDANLKTISIVSMDGKIMLTKNTDANLQEIDVSGFAKGIYLIKVETQNGKLLNSKFVKN